MRVAISSVEPMITPASGEPTIPPRPTGRSVEPVSFGHRCGAPLLLVREVEINMVDLGLVDPLLVLGRQGGRQ